MTLTGDARLLFATRMARMFGYGLISVVLVLYLVALGLEGVWVGAILTLTLLGDAAISLWLTTHADRLGRRLAAPHRRHHRGDQPQRQRGRPVPGGRAGRPLPDRPGR
jgi:MFS family permease